MILKKATQRSRWNIFFQYVLNLFWILSTVKKKFHLNMHPIFSIHYWNIWQFSLSMFRNFPQTILLLLRLTSGKSLECCSTMSHFQWHQKRTKIYYKISWHRGWYLILSQTTCKSKLQDLITPFLLIWKLFSSEQKEQLAEFLMIFNCFQIERML